MRNRGWNSALWLTAVEGLFMAGCGGGSSTTPPPPSKGTPTVTVTPAVQSISAVQSLQVTVTLTGSSGTPTGTVTLTNGSYNSAPATLTGGSATITIPAGSLASGTDALTANYTPDTSSSSIYNSASGAGNVTVTTATPTVTVLAGALSISTTQSDTVTVTVSGGAGNPTPTGSVTLSGGGFTSTAMTLTGGGVQIVIPAGAVAVGTDTLTGAYTPDTKSSTTYASATGMGSVAVSLTVPVVTVTPGSSSTSSNITANQPLTVTVSVSGGSGATAPSGSVTLSGGGYTSPATVLTAGSAQITIPANSLSPGIVTLTANYTPDKAGSSLYASATGSVPVTVASAVAYTLTVDSAGPSSGISITANPADNNSKAVGTTPFTLTYNGGSQVTLSAALSDMGYSFVSWSGCTTASGSNCTVNIGANTTVTATYNQSGISSISVTPITATIGTQQQFAAQVNGTGGFSNAVTWSVAAPAGSTLSPGTINSAGLYNTPFPAPPTVTVTATSVQDTSISGSAVVTLNQPTTATGPVLTVDVGTPGNSSENPHTISSYVYGMNGYVLDPASEQIANLGVIRWGGDDISRYNYQANMTNSASDYYFENFQGAGGQFPNANGGTNFTQFLQSVDSAGAATLGTVPVNGWVSNTTQYACSFTEAAYPNQESYESGCGDGIDTGGTDLFGSNTIAAITSIPATPPDITANGTPAPGSSSSTLSTWADATWSGGWVNSVVKAYGDGASGTGVALWDLDNEPTWWDAVHRDVHPNPFTYDEVTDNGLGTALAIKSADPTALVSGPVMDNWWAYFYSKKDIESGYTTGPCYEPWSDPADRTAHGGIAMLEYYLQQFNKYSQSYGVRLLDYLDVHAYFAPLWPLNNTNGTSVAFTTAGDTQEQIERMNGTRVFWDPTYTDPDTANQPFPQPNYITDTNYTSSCPPPAQSPQVIPMMQKWVAADYPGTKTAIDEYNFGGMESINGAVVEADILGIFGRQNLGMGALWATTNYSTQGPGNYAFAMYRNYDGKDSTFGDTYLYATSMASGADAENKLAVYGAQRSKDNTITVIVINKTYGSMTSIISLENFSAAAGTTAQVYQYSNANLNEILPQAAVKVTPPAGTGTTSTITNYTFPAQSITLFVVPD